MLAEISLVVSVLVLASYVYVRLSLGICRCSTYLEGKVVIVTGGNSGIGYETAKNLAGRGARVILACRSEQRGQTARDNIIKETGNENVHFKKIDLASFASIRAFADNINKHESRVDVLINNGGVMPKFKKEYTEDGSLLAMQVNHFGPFLLTHLLLDKLKASAPSRMINVSSISHLVGEIELDNLNMENEISTTVEPRKIYPNSKLCNILMAVELSRQLKGTGVTVNAACPGAVITPMVAEVEYFWYKLILPFMRPFFKTAWEGAQTIIHLAISPEVSDISGEFFRDCGVAKRINKAKDVKVARKLWEVSEKLCQIII